MNIDMNRVMAYAKVVASKYSKPQDMYYEDMVGDCLLTATKAIKNYNPDDDSNASIYSYIYKSMEYEMFNNFNRKKYHNNLNDTAISRDEILSEYDMDIMIDEDDNDGDFLKKQHLIDINEILLCLKSEGIKNEKMLKVFYGVYFQDKSLSEIGIEIGISIERVRQYKEKILTLFRFHFKKKGELK